MLLVRMFSSSIYRVRVAKPLDEAQRMAEIGGPLELELVDWHPGACRTHSVEFVGTLQLLTLLRAPIYVTQAHGSW